MVTSPIERTPRTTPAEERPPSAGAESRATTLWRLARRYPIPLVAAGLLLISGMLALAAPANLWRWPLLLIIVVGGAPLLIETARQLVHREFGVDLLAAMAIVGSLLLGEYLAGAVIVLMLSGGEALEAFALSRARRSLSALAERAPRVAHLFVNGELVTVAADTVEVGAQVIAKPGEVIPVDGVVAEGSSSVSEADLTGEPVPLRKEPGSLVLSGSLNLDSPLRINATKRSAESQYAQIVRLVEEAQASKAPIHRLADRYAVWFTAIAVVVAAVAWIRTGQPVDALAVLVVATPCPLILATPIAIMSGIDRAARDGLITKSGATIEDLGGVDVVVFDKTGTLTLGMPKLTEVAAVSVASEGAATIASRATPDQDTLIALAASVEQYSPHILARAVVDAAHERGAQLRAVTDMREIPGQGIEGNVAYADHGVDQIKVAVGNRAYLGSLGIDLPSAVTDERARRTEQGQIVSFLALDGQFMGLLVFADVPRPELAQLTPELKAAGIKQTVLLTGDGVTVAEQIGKLAHVDRVVAHCLPENKVAVVRELQESGSHVLMVGDGVNDAPALATASVGIAIGSQGLTAASSAADAVLLSPNILRIASSVRLGRQVMRVARQGIGIGIGLSIIAMIFAALGYIPPTEGALLQEVIDVIVILNALRAGRQGLREERHGDQTR
ncbi:MAG TPA: heavy metal translocating P-type ATPase [Ktedonobacterales bacterium]|nr:heavy metal translocating P-type ATPase [Ktedonobacterales bacterium]